mgnify:CR=1 FL=1
MIQTGISDFPDALTNEQIEFFQKEFFLTFGRLLTEEELIPLRFAYERAWEGNPLTQEDGGNAVPGHRSMPMLPQFDQPELAKLIANDRLLTLAAGALKTTVDRLEYVGGNLNRQRIQKPWTYEEFGWPGWHQDASPDLDSPKRLNVWLYLDDCTRDEGVTQALVGSCELQRENLRAGRAPEQGIDQLQQEQDLPEDGVWAEAPAGGGFTWTGFLVHRISPNLSGKARRLVTYAYGIQQEVESHFRDNTTPDQRAQIADMLPPDKRYLVGC